MVVLELSIPAICLILLVTWAVRLDLGLAIVVYVVYVVDVPVIMILWIGLLLLVNILWVNLVPWAVLFLCKVETGEWVIENTLGANRAAMICRLAVL